MGSLPEQNEMTTSTHQSAITVSTGPAGRAMAEPMSKDMLDLMQAYLNFERQSAADYFAAAIWFAERELVGFAEHLRDEAKQEQEHAAKFADYLISRGQRPVLDTVETPRQKKKTKNNTQKNKKTQKKQIINKPRKYPIYKYTTK